jgi:acyl-homoserine lactone acylase PvdQ
MDPELMTLASAGGTALVTLIATDAWEKGKAVAGRLWARRHPERAEVIEGEVVETRETLLAARAEDGDRAEIIEQQLATEWTSRLWRLVAADDALRDDLRAAVEELTAALGEQDRTRIDSITITATNSGEGTMNVLGQGRQTNLNG